MIVLIDDDKLIHLGWKLRASKAGLQIRSFYSVDEFLSENIPTDSIKNVFIDSDLGNDFKGEIEAKKIYELGYRNIILTTGHTDIDKKNYPWLKEVRSKEPPFCTFRA